MALVLTDLGADALLKIIFNNVRALAGNDLTLRLFSNNVVPAQSGTTLIETVGGGYLPKTLTMGSWTFSAVNDPSVIEYPSQSFTLTALTGLPNVYGYYITDADGVAIWAEVLPSPFVPPNNGDPLIVVPTLAMASGLPA